jgi:hypothetical protein
LPGAIDDASCLEIATSSVRGQEGSDSCSAVRPSLGSPCDLFLRLHNAMAAYCEAEDTGAEEGILDITLPADGVYRLKVEDTNHRGGADEAYRIAVEPYQPGFTLAAAAEKVDAPQNGVFV